MRRFSLFLLAGVAVSSAVCGVSRADDFLMDHFPITRTYPFPVPQTHVTRELAAGFAEAMVWKAAFEECQKPDFTFAPIRESLPEVKQTPAGISVTIVFSCRM